METVLETLLSPSLPRQAQAGIGSAQSKLPANRQEAPSSGRECEQLATEIAQLQEALASRAAIEQAKGILMARYGISPDRAFDVLRRWSQSSQIKLRVLAEGLVTLTCGDPNGREDARVVNVIVEQLGRGAKRLTSSAHGAKPPAAWRHEPDRD